MAQDTMSELTAAESQAFEEFSSLYTQMNPPPERPTAQIISLLGWEFWVMVLISIASLVLSSLRTGSYFYLAAAGIQGLNQETNMILGVVEAVMAVLTYEGFLLMMGVMDGKKRMMSPFLKWTMIVLGLVTTTAAGLGVSLNIIPDGKSTSGTLLAVLGILMGFASFLAFFSGELLGSLFAEARGRIQEVTRSWKSDMDQWERVRRNSWEAKRTKMIRRVGGQIDEERAPVQAQEVKAVSVNISALVEKYLEDKGMSVLEEISSNEVARELSSVVGGQVNPASVRKIVQRLREKKSNGHSQN